MRTLPVVLVTAALAGCGGRGLQPVDLSGPAPASSAQTMDCVRQQFTRMAYTVTDTDAAMGSVTATHVNEQPWWLRLLGFRATADQITATSSGNQLRVTAISSDPTAPAGGGPAPAGGASSAAQSDAQQLLRACSARS